MENEKMIHIQKDNEGFDFPIEDICSINIATNIHLNQRGLRQYINKVYVKIKPSDNVFCEGENIDKEEVLYRFDEFKDIRSITIDDTEYVVPWRESKEKYAVNIWQKTISKTDDTIEIMIFKSREDNKK